MNHNDRVVCFFLVGFITQLTQEKAEMSHENSWRVIYFEVWNHLHEKGRSFCSTVDDGERFSQGSILIPEANFTVLTSISGWQRSEDKPFVSNCQEASLMWKNMKKPWFLDVFRVPRVPHSPHIWPGSPWPIRKGLNSSLMPRSGHASPEPPWHLGQPWCW